jgi:hypothetical protein
MRPIVWRKNRRPIENTITGTVRGERNNASMLRLKRIPLVLSARAAITPRTTAITDEITAT